MSLSDSFIHKRRAGVLLHPTSLPGPPGNGDLGPNAYWFVDFLVRSGISLWQTLPLGPPHGDLSPYQAQSAHAGNPLLISHHLLAHDGWLPAEEAWPEDEKEIHIYRRVRLREAHAGFLRHAGSIDRHAYADFRQRHAHWLEDYALFRALRRAHKNAPWWEWPAEQRDREPGALEKVHKALANDIEQIRFEQFLFFRQWLSLKRYANDRGVRLFGDLPIFVATDSVDVWANQANFQLDAQGRPAVVAGVPPDYFSATGQRWGNPHYNWEYMQANGFQWWRERLRAQEVLFDLVRIDHFRGFEAYWEIPASEPTAMNGRWVQAPGEALFETLQAAGTLPLVAEDLGVITPEVDALRRKFGIPGMKILQFAFDGSPDNPYLPHNHEQNCVVYTGTHDNNTTLGWFQELPPAMQSHVCDYLGADAEDMPWALVRAALASVARLAILPMQDVLSGDAGQRMNTPGTSEGNWRWRFTWEDVPHDIHNALRHLVEMYGRL